MNWKQQWIDGVLEDVPSGSYRRRLENELNDHLETRLHALMGSGRTEAEAQAEALEAMGAPDQLREEYRAAWRRSWPGRREALRRQLWTWVCGCAVMLGAHCLISYVMGTMWRMAISLPGDSHEPWIRLIRGTIGDLNNSWLRLFLPLTLALIAGAYYLGRKFRASRCPAALISVGLFVHWTFIAAFEIWWEALDDHRTFWEELKVYLPYNAVYYFSTFALCILLGVVFGYLSAKPERPAAA